MTDVLSVTSAAEARTLSAKGKEAAILKEVKEFLKEIDVKILRAANYGDSKVIDVTAIETGNGFVLSRPSLGALDVIIQHLLDAGYTVDHSGKLNAINISW